MSSDIVDLKFDYVEYSVVAVMLLLSNLIGVYYTFINKQDTFNEYMLGGRRMGVFPVAMSIVASFISGITILGLPTEIYGHGTQYAASTVSSVIIMILVAVFYQPVYFQLQLTSVFEYLELRFNSTVRILGTFMYSLNLIVILPVVIYVPALAFNQVTDIPVHIITPMILASCIFYTAFGGLRAVMWTDALQNIFTLLAVLSVVVLGCKQLGGVTEIWNINKNSSRIEFFNMDPDPFARNTFWTVVIGCMFAFLTNIGVSPGSVQRYLAVPSLTKARLVLVFSFIGLNIICNLSNFLGLVLYARYHSCDPLAAGIIKKPSQLVPLYVMEICKDYPGLAGLFMSGVLAAALSTLSAWLNTLAGTLYKDVNEVFFPNVQYSEAKQSTIIKVIIITIGIVCGCLVTVVEKLGTVLQMAISLQGLVYGSLLAVFTLGIFFPRANVKGAVAGTLASLLVAGWVTLHAQYYTIVGKLQYPGKVTSIDNCPASVYEHFNSSVEALSTYRGVGTPVIADSSVALMYRLSYNYYMVLGTLTGIVVGMVVSLMTHPPPPTTLYSDLFTPWVHRFLPANVKVQPPTRPNRVEYALSGHSREMDVIKSGS